MSKLRVPFGIVDLPGLDPVLALHVKRAPVDWGASDFAKHANQRPWAKKPPQKKITHGARGIVLELRNTSEMDPTQMILRVAVPRPSPLRGLQT